MYWDLIDWKALERMRSAFLSGTAGHGDYWRNETDLASYDATYAQRIGWKWDYVLQELTRRRWTPPAGGLLDWGCGSGIAHRAFLYHFGPGQVSALRVWDRSVLAMNYAANKARAKYPQLPVTSGSHEHADISTVLLSHVLTELDSTAVNELCQRLQSATSVFWVEPGTYEVSRRLIDIREKLRASFSVVAPCTHQANCGMLEARNSEHWCHHFASPPPEVFTDSDWGRFAHLTSIDLRSLPVSFLVLDKRPVAALPVGATRIIGRPRIYKPHATLLGCEISGVSEKRLNKRDLPGEFRRWKKDEADVLQQWTTVDGEIIAAKPLIEDQPQED